MTPILAFINVLLELIVIAIVIRVVMSWVNVNKTSGFFLFIRDVTEPILAPFQKYVPRIGMIDISPIVAILAIDLLRSLIVKIMMGM
ncbi:YggT family protein [Candidatus Peregrinibacteria bacterium]|jgi:YggT family protein|nr:YggT family protein [Candidatus Peregrinibacteria bacterium]